MTMTREEKIFDIAAQYAINETDGQNGGKAASKRGLLLSAFRDGAHWADSHPQWQDAQGDIVPEYDREVIVIGRDGKVFYGHRPDPKEVTMIDGKPYHAKTYDKNGWNWSDIALWLDVEVPDELIDKITTEYFKENKYPTMKIDDNYRFTCKFRGSKVTYRRTCKRCIVASVDDNGSFYCPFYRR